MTMTMPFISVFGVSELMLADTTAVWLHCVSGSIAPLCR
mgnify:CR=1 FL=1